MNQEAKQTTIERMAYRDDVFIIDGSSFLYRAYYSIRALTTRTGIPVNAVYGFCRMIRKLVDTYNPQYLVLVWDSKGKTVRHEIYEDYKKTRQAAPNDLFQQKELIQEFADIVGIKQLATPAIEADDLMYSVAKELSLQSQRSILVTSDKDLGQALGEYVTILDPFKDAFVTRRSLEEKVGFSLDKLPFYYALVGDSSDNIPGVAGIGPKGAQGLVQQFSSLQDLYDHLDQVPSERTRLLLTQSKANAFLSEQLFTLRTYETYATRESFQFSESDWEKAYPFFQKLEFKSFLKGAESLPAASEVTLPQKYTFVLVDTGEMLAEVCNQIRKAGHCAIDTETTGLNPRESQLVGISVCVEEGTAYYIPFGHITIEKQISRELVFALLRPLFEDPSIKKYLHHAKFDALMLSYAGISLKGISFDTMIAASLIVEEGQGKGLKALSEYYLQEPMTSFAEMVKKHKYKNFSFVPLGLATDYAAADAHQTFRLVRLFEKELHDRGLYDLFTGLEMRLMQILQEMELTGIALDTHELASINTVVTRQIQGLEVEIKELLGPEYAQINLQSPKQIEELLFVRLQLPVIKKTTSRGAYSTDQEVLMALAQLHPVPALIMKHRELTKLKSTYLDALAECVYEGRVHTTFNQTLVATGRLASSDPNLQNIPVDQFALRGVFKPKPGYVYLSADYSQIELRVLAYLSQDETLIQAFAEKRDIHALTAAGLFKVPLDQVTHEQRQLGKRINFSILYGLTAHGLSKDLGISHSLAKTYIENYMAQYPGVVAWMDSVIETTKEKGYVETFWGRRRALPGIYERNKTLFDQAKRYAINTVAQGTAAEIMKWGMMHLDDVLTKQSSPARMILQIHDELLLEVPREDAVALEQLVTQVLERVVEWNVPLVVTTRTGNSWQEVTK